jgi:heme-degrading monooxygenase HmoA
MLSPELKYLVVFKSKSKKNIDEKELEFRDQQALKAAQNSKGFLSYTPGVKDKNNDSLSYCYWESKEDAQKGAAHNDHKKAASLANEVYVSHSVEKYTAIENYLFIKLK